MALSNWLCMQNTKNMVVKIVHPGGRIELYDRPVLAAEIMVRNPRCCITYPHVFREPSAIVDPDTVLMLGQKFYVVPVNTIRKLQRRQPRRPLSPLPDVSMIQSPQPQISVSDEDNDGSDSCYRLFGNKNTPKLSNSLKQSDEDAHGLVTSSSTGTKYRKEIGKNGNSSNDGCLTCLLQGSKLKSDKNSTDDTASDMESSEFEVLAERGRRNNAWESPNRPVTNYPTPPHDYSWQPSLASINEE